MNDIPTTFVQPQKLICDDKHKFSKFKFSKTFLMLNNFIDTLCVLAQGQDCYSVEQTEFTSKLDIILTKVLNIFESIPPVQRQSRYGNPSFLKFIEHLQTVSEELHKDVLLNHEEAWIEIKYYFMDMFGSYGRLDYGTGHELNFLCWFISFCRIGIAGSKEDLQSFVLNLFPKYMQIALKIQNIYTLEPAGSRGAWSVDDYNLLPFVIGSSQFSMSDISVKIIFDDSQIMKYREKNLYAFMVSNIIEVKSYSLEINSPFISEIHYKDGMNWAKIFKGMRRHYNEEVFGKWPVMQHFWFGNIFGIE
eukprot:EST47666.1 Phosphotyrosyl phosphatase activator protein [Spironucleus salmonicida]